ncbi:YdcF family protein [Swingsia samuiensis]|uniref:YdcF family protein n=2 Tax=Swingsia samuiensis TaxID=1293412 RepID=A0A4Y6UPQ4_9PROT|nr:YdcF family protein [Swingsia samuiensis]
MAVIAVKDIRTTPELSDVAVIFGTAVTAEGEPRWALRERLKTGLSLWKNKKATVLMVSGAIEKKNHNQDEAQIMAHWLEKEGVPAQAIMIDSHGNNTWCTAQNTARFFPHRRLIVVTQWFHVARARWALSQFDFQHISAAYPRHFKIIEIWYLFREAIAWPAYMLLK